MFGKVIASNIIIILLILTPYVESEEIYLLHFGPTQMGTPAAKHETILFKLSGDHHSLINVWSMGEYEVKNISIFDQIHPIYLIGSESSNRMLYQISLDKEVNIKSLNLPTDSYHFTVGVNFKRCGNC